MSPLAKITLPLSVFIAASLISCSDSSPQSDELEAASPDSSEPVQGSNTAGMGGPDTESAADNTDNGSADADGGAGLDDDTGADASTGSDVTTDPADGSGAGTDNSSPITAESETGQLIQSIKRTSAIALIDLNSRLRGGQDLTVQQEECLGSYDPALGEALLAIDCTVPLATGDVAVYVTRAAFVDTASCHMAMLNNDAGPCTLATARITVPTQFVTAAAGELPRPVPGAEITYQLDSASLILQNNPSSLTGYFRCEIDLSSGLPIANENQPGNCNADISRVRERLDALLGAGLQTR